MDVKRFFRRLTGAEEKPDFSKTTPYQILEIPKSASFQDIKTAYFDMVKIYTPEIHPDEFMVIRKAYETLKEPDTRAEIDVKCLAHPAKTPGYEEIKSTGTGALVDLNKDIAGLEASQSDQAALIQALKERSVAYVEKESWKEAMKDWEQILQYAPQDEQTTRNLELVKFQSAFSLAKQNKIRDALAAYLTLLEEHPEERQILLNVAILTDAADGIGKSATYWTRLQSEWKSDLSASPEDEYLKNLLGQVQKLLAGHKPSAAEVTTTPTAAPSRSAATLQLANSLIEQKQYTKAIAMLEAMLKQGQSQVEVHDSLGWAQLHSGLIDDAFRTWRRAMKEFKNHPTLKDSVTRAHLQLGKSMFEAGHMTPATTHLKQAVAGDPKNIEIYDLLAQIYLKKGDPVTAIDLWTKALRINPKSKQFQKAIRLAKLKTRK